MSRQISEFQLKELFKNRKFRPDLRAVSGNKVEVLQTGESNSDAGPDFRHSLVRVNGITLRGDIELHRLSSDWYAHNHHQDRNYNSVVLHVVVQSDERRDCFTFAGRKIETVALENFLTDDAADFLNAYEPEEHLTPIRCAVDNGKISFETKLEYLALMGEKRFVHKVTKLEERLKDIIDENRPVVFEAKQKYFRDFNDLHIEHRSFDQSELRNDAYWDQLLYEGILEGLGYSKNTAAFRKLARNVTLSLLSEYAAGDRLAVEAIMFGAAGLLPKETGRFDEESKEYCVRLETAWRGVKKKYRREIVDQSEWLFFKLRPQNFPTVRIAGATALITGTIMKHHAGELIRAASQKGERGFVESWREILIVPAADYWSRHFVFGANATSEVRMLIGAGRAEEIIINVVLPLTYLMGKVFREENLSVRAKRIYANHPPTSDNSITLTIKEHLFGGDNVIASVAVQQGALHLYRTLCSERRCERCKIGKVLYPRTAA